MAERTNNQAKLQTNNLYGTKELFRYIQDMQLLFHHINQSQNSSESAGNQTVAKSAEPEYITPRISSTTVSVAVPNLG